MSVGDQDELHRRCVCVCVYDYCLRKVLRDLMDLVDVILFFDEM